MRTSRVSRSIHTLVEPGRRVGGPCRSGGGGAGAPLISRERLQLRIDKAYALYQAKKGFLALSELEDLQRDVGLIPLHPVGLKPIKITGEDSALGSAEVLLMTARELKGRGFKDLAQICLISGMAEFASDLYAQRSTLPKATTSRAIDDLLGCVDELISLEGLKSADEILKLVAGASGFSDDQLTRMGNLLAKRGKLESALELLMGWDRSVSGYLDLVSRRPEFVKPNLADLLTGMREALRVGVLRFKSKSIDIAGLLECELPILFTLLEHSPRAALLAYQLILLPLVDRSEPINPTGSLRPIAEAVEEVAQRPEVGLAHLSTGDMLNVYFEAVAEFVKQVLILKQVNPQEGLWHEIPIILRTVPDPKFKGAMAAFTDLYLAYVEGPNDDLKPKAMRQILPLLPNEKFEAGLKSMAEMVRTGIDPLTRLDELVR